MSTIYSVFAHNLKTLRQARSLSQGEIGERCGIGRATIASIEGGRQSVLLHQAVALATALDVPLPRLLESPRGELVDELRGIVTDEDLQKILAITKDFR